MLREEASYIDKPSKIEVVSYRVANVYFFEASYHPNMCFYLWSLDTLERKMAKAQEVLGIEQKY